MSKNNRRTHMFYADIEHKRLDGGVQGPTSVQLSPAHDRTLEGVSSRGVRGHTNEKKVPHVKRRTTKNAEIIPELEETYTYPLPKTDKDQYNGTVTLLDLGGEVRVVQKRGLSGHYAVRQLHKENAHRIISQLTEIRHKNLVAAIETFTEGNNIYIIVDKMLLSLIQIVLSPPIPSAEEIGVIMGQVKIYSQLEIDEHKANYFRS